MASWIKKNLDWTHLLIKSTSHPRGLWGSAGDLANRSVSFKTPHGLATVVVLFTFGVVASFSELSFVFEVCCELVLSLFKHCCSVGFVLCLYLVTAETSVVAGADDPGDNDEEDDDEDVGVDVVVVVVVMVVIAATVVVVVTEFDVVATASVTAAGALLIIVYCSGCRDILNVLNLLSGSKTTTNNSNRYGLSRFICKAHNCINFPHVFNMQ